MKRITAIIITMAVMFTCVPMMSGSLSVNAASPYWQQFKVKATSATSVKVRWKALTKKQQKKIKGIVVFRNV